MFDGERGITLHAMQGNRASSCGEGEFSLIFSSCARSCGIFSNYGGDDPSKLVFVKQCQDTCLVTRDTSGISTRLGRAIQTLFEVRQKTKCPFLVATVILGFLSIFKKSQTMFF